MKSKARIHFEQNMLDGDDVNNCGGAMLSAKSVLEYIEEYMYPLAQQEERERIIQIVRERKTQKPHFHFNKYNDALDDIINLVTVYDYE